MDVNFGAVNISLLKRSVEVTDFSLQLNSDSLPDRCHTIQIKEIALTGIKILPLFLSEKLHINNISLKQGNLLIDQAVIDELKKLKSKKGSTAGSMEVSAITIGLLAIDSLSFAMVSPDADSCRKDHDLRVSDIRLSLSDLSVRKNVDVTYTIHKFVMQEVDYTPSVGAYAYHVGRVDYHDEALTVDSILLKPRYSKFQFAHEVGKQTDRINLYVSQLSINKLMLDDLRDSTLSASSIRIRDAELYAFRDKRLPFIKDHSVPLPMKMFKDLSIDVKVDSLIVDNAKVSYEEFPEKGDDSGVISFHRLNAVFTPLNNRMDEPNKFVNLQVETEFMNSGKLKCRFQFPTSSSNLYYAEGTLMNFDLTTLNGALEPLMNVRIASGRMNSLAFNFDYNTVESKGNLLLNYEDLKVVALKKDEDVIDKLKSFILNLFIIKSDKDEEVRKDKRTGEINFKRDPKRSVFNYWWKSIADGVKSTYSLEKMIKKEE